MVLDISLSKQEPILAFLLLLQFIIEVYHYYYGSITLFYIILLNCIKLNYIILLHHYYLLVLSFLFCFFFDFRSFIIFTFTFQVINDLVSYLLLYLVFVLLCLPLLSLFIPRVLFGQMFRVKITVSFFFPSRLLYENMFQIFFF